MIFRLTQKMTKKVGLPPLQAVPLDKNPFIDWTAHLFTAERVQYIIVTNTASLYSLVMYGRGITDDNRFFQETLRVPLSASHCAAHRKNTVLQGK